MKYMLLFFADEHAWMALSEDDRGSAIERIGSWYGEQAGSGRIIEGRRLVGGSSATTIDLGPAGTSREPARRDGPFAQAREVLGSYAIVNVADTEEATAVAESWPGGGFIEIRPVAEE